MQFVKQPDVASAPNASTPLVGVVSFETDEPAFVEIDVDDGRKQWTLVFDDPAETSHGCPILGLRPDTSHRLTVRARNADGDVAEAANSLELRTPALPDDFPPINVETCVAEKREPGFMVMPISYGPMMKTPEKPGFLVAFDQDGNVVWYHREKTPYYDLRRMPNGNIAYATNDYRLVEIDFLGNIHNTWYPTGKHKDGIEGGIPVKTETVHHAFCPMPSGNILALSIEQKEIDDWPGSDRDRDAPRGPAKVIGDVIIEFQPDGTVVNEWSAFDILDPQRIGYGSFAPFWVMRGYPDSKDWCHANSVNYDAGEDSILISFRHMDAVVKISRATGELIWIMGTHDNWKEPWASKLLAPQPGHEWQYHQHDISLTPNGGVMMFDNGTFRASPFDKPTPAPQNYSRAVEFEVDGNNMTVSQRWSFDAGKDSKYYCTFVCGAYRLPQTDNVFVTFGGVSYEDDGTPTDMNMLHRVMARHVEVTRDGKEEKVFETSIEDTSAFESAVRWFSFRAEHFPSLYG